MSQSPGGWLQAGTGAQAERVPRSGLGWAEELSLRPASNQ